MIVAQTSLVKIKAKILFMGIENKIFEEEVEGVVYLEEEIISALE